MVKLMVKGPSRTGPHFRPQSVIDLSRHPIYLGGLERNALFAASWLGSVGSSEPRHLSAPSGRGGGPITEASSVDRSPRHDPALRLAGQFR